MINKSILVALVLVVGIVIISASVSQKDSTRYEYMTIVQRSNWIEITHGEKNYEIITIDDEIPKAKGLLGYSKKNDFRPLFKRVNQYEQQGWQLVSSQYFFEKDDTHTSNYVLMRKPIN